MAAYKQEFPETEKERIFSFLKGKVPTFELLSLQTRLLVWGEGEGEEIMQIMEGEKNHPTGYEFHQYSST